MCDIIILCRLVIIIIMTIIIIIMITITSPLNNSTLNEASVMAGSAAKAAELRKNAANDEKCNRLGCMVCCIPLTVETLV